MQYKIIPVFKHVEIAGKKNLTTLIDYYEKTLNEESRDGWRFKGETFIRSSTPPGCIGGIFGASPIYEDHKLFIFERD